MTDPQRPRTDLRRATKVRNRPPENAATVWLRIDLGAGPEWIAIAKVGR